MGFLQQLVHCVYKHPRKMKQIDLKRPGTARAMHNVEPTPWRLEKRASGGSKTLPGRAPEPPGEARCTQEAPESAQETPKSAQEAPKTRPRGAQERPRDAQERPRETQKPPGRPLDPSKIEPGALQDEFWARSSRRVGSDRLPKRFSSDVAACALQSVHFYQKC